MSRKATSIILFAIGFILTYVILCFVIPNGIKWIEDATPVQKMIGNVRYMAVLKTVISLVVGLIIGAIPAIKKK